MSSTDLSRLIETANEHEERIRELEAIIDEMPTAATLTDLSLRVDDIRRAVIAIYEFAVEINRHAIAGTYPLPKTVSQGSLGKIVTRDHPKPSGKVKIVAPPTN